MKKYFLLGLCLILITSIANGQKTTVVGNVYAFKNLRLNNIKVVAKKAKSEVTTDPQGNFKITCDSRDKLEFSGNGLQKTIITINNKNPKSVAVSKVKMLFLDNEKNRAAAIENGHFTEKKLQESIEKFPEYNINYNTYPDFYTAIDRIYTASDNVKVSQEKVFISSEKSTASKSIPAIYIVDGKRALDISHLQMSDIESIKVIADGSSKYGLAASQGAVIVTTLLNEK